MSAGSLARTVLDLHGEDAFGAIVGLNQEPVSVLLAEPKLTLVESTPGQDPPPRPRVPASTAVVLGVTALSDFQICPRRFSLIQLQGLREPGRSPGPRLPLAEGDADPRLAGIAAHHVLEVWPLDRWGEAPDPAFLAAALAKGGLSAKSQVGQRTLEGLARFLSGPYAARVKRDAVRVEREVPLTVTLEGASPAELPSAAVRSPKKNPAQLELFAPPTTAPAGAVTAAGPALVIKATLDLLVELEDGSLHVIDYKRSRGGGADHARYAPQLSLYRSVVARAFGRPPQVGLLHLLGDAEEPEWLSPETADPAAISRAFLAARAEDVWRPVPEATCRAVHCGFITSCHFSGSGPD